MTIPNTSAAEASRMQAARNWVTTLARYRDPSLLRSVFELVVTLVPFALLWALAWAALSFTWSSITYSKVIRSEFDRPG